MDRASVHIVCPHCSAINRIPAGRPAERAKCGSCHLALFEGKPLAVTAEAFDRHVGRNDVPVLVDFWAPWCGPCRIIAPHLEELQSEREDIRIVKLNVDENPQTAAQYNVMSIPMLLLFKHGQVAHQIIGAMPKSRLVQEIDPALAA
jgi:thioredoxin